MGVGAPGVHRALELLECATERGISWCGGRRDERESRADQVRVTARREQRGAKPEVGETIPMGLRNAWPPEHSAAKARCRSQGIRIAAATCLTPPLASECRRSSSPQHIVVVGRRSSARVSCATAVASRNSRRSTGPSVLIVDRRDSSHQLECQVIGLSGEAALEYAVKRRSR